MDTAGYLTRQGWRGTGHALHPTGRGIKKPLLISQKKNVLGIGKKKHDAHADQWWARAFDSSLKDLNVVKVEGRKLQSPDILVAEESETGEGKGQDADVTVKRREWCQLDMLRAGGAKWVGEGGLYGGFVKGQGLTGTIGVKAVALASKLEGPKTLNGVKNTDVAETGDHKASTPKKVKRASKDEKEGRKIHTKRAEVADRGETDNLETKKSFAKTIRVTRPESDGECRERRSHGNPATVTGLDTTGTSIRDPMASTPELKPKKKKRQKQHQIDVLKGIPGQIEEANPVRKNYVEDRQNQIPERMEDTAKRLRKEARRAKKAQGQACRQMPMLNKGK